MGWDGMGLGYEVWSACVIGRWVGGYSTGSTALV